MSTPMTRERPAISLSNNPNSPWWIDQATPYRPAWAPTPSRSSPAPPDDSRSAHIPQLRRRVSSSPPPSRPTQGKRDRERTSSSLRSISGHLFATVGRLNPIIYQTAATPPVTRDTGRYGSTFRRRRIDSLDSGRGVKKMKGKAPPEWFDSTSTSDEEEEDFVIVSSSPRFSFSSLVQSLVESAGSEDGKRRSLRHEYSLCSWDFLNGPSRHRRSPSQFNLMQPSCFVSDRLFNERSEAQPARRKHSGSSRVRRALAGCSWWLAGIKGGRGGAQRKTCNFQSI